MNKLTGLVLPVLQKLQNSDPLKHNPLKHFLLWQENKVINDTEGVQHSMSA